jgi:hypothetical protein
MKIKIQDHYECGDGWKPIIDNVLNEIIKYNLKNKEKIIVTQIKEKFGGLRIYTNFSIDYIDALIDVAEEESYKTCEKCGSKVNITTNTTGWYKTLCDNCRNNNESEASKKKE